MKKLWIFALTLTTVFAFTSASQARSDGPETGGGGGVIFVGPSTAAPRMIDMYNLTERQQLELRRRYSGQNNSQQRLRVKESTADLLNYDPAFRQADSLLNQWFDNLATRALNVNITEMLMGSIQWTFTNTLQRYENHYRPTHLPRGKNIYTVAHYLKKESPEVKTVLSIWNQMPLVDQTALVLHESLRHYQLGMGQSIDDELLQKATVLVLYCSPSAERKGDLYSLLGTASPLSASQKKALFSRTILKCQNELAE